MAAFIGNFSLDSSLHLAGQAKYPKDISSLIKQSRIHRRPDSSPAELCEAGHGSWRHAPHRNLGETQHSDRHDHRGNLICLKSLAGPR